MAICNCNTSQLLLHFFIILPVLSPVSISLATALSFNFTSFTKGDLEYERAFAQDGVINLPYRTVTVGRATYRKPLHLWDKDTGTLTDFKTHFSFLIDSQNKSVYGDGIAFFLAPIGSNIPDVRKGGSLGLTNDDQNLNSTSNPFVAVEFDIYTNSWDPPGEHVGIDVCSMRSSKNLTWWVDIRGGKMNEAWITYNSTTQNLTAVFTGFRDNSTLMQSLDFRIDLKLYLPDWVTFGFSAATGNASAIFKIFSWTFSSDLYVALDLPMPNRPDGKRRPWIDTPHSRGKNETPLAVGLSLLGVILVGVLISMFWIAGFGRNRKDKEDNHGINEYIFDGEFVRVVGKKFSYKELARATNNFNDKQKLGEGGYGEVYKGFLKDINSFIAVRKVSKVSKQGMEGCSSKVKIISRIHHRNFVQLLGWCHEKNVLLLVYEFMPNGSLDSHLFKNNVLTWEFRCKIAQDLASGLLYLQEECELYVGHGDIKSSNIMLDSNFNAKIGDVGLARLVEHATGSQTTGLIGTIGYIAPERYYFKGKASKESDIYSFGIVALEIACGRKPIERKDISLVDWVWDLYGKGKLLEAADPRLSGDFDEQQLKCLMIVGLWCCHPHENLRPSMRQVIQVLDFESPLPILPSKMPTYFPPAENMSATDSSLSSSGTGFNIDSLQLTSSSSASPTTSRLNTRLAGYRIFKFFFLIEQDPDNLSSCFGWSCISR